MMTEFGGAVAVPSAVRSSDSTTTIRVNDVIMIRIDGAIDSTVRSAISWIARSVTPPLPWPRLMLISCANAGPASDPAAISVAKHKTLRGTGADLTKGSLDGPAMTPSRLRDFQNRSSRAGQPAGPPMARCGERCARAAALAPPGARRPVVRRCRLRGGEGLPPAVAPSRRDFGPLPTQPGTGTAGSGAAPRNAPVRVPGAPSELRSGAAGGVSRGRCAKLRAMASALRAARGATPDGRQ